MPEEKNEGRPGMPCGLPLVKGADGLYHKDIRQET